MSKFKSTSEYVDKILLLQHLKLLRLELQRVKGQTNLQFQNLKLKQPNFGINNLNKLCTLELKGQKILQL